MLNLWWRSIVPCLLYRALLAVLCTAVAGMASSVPLLSSLKRMYCLVVTGRGSQFELPPPTEKDSSEQLQSVQHAVLGKAWRHSFSYWRVLVNCHPPPQYCC